MRKNVKRFAAAAVGLVLLSGVFTATSYAVAESSDSATDLRVMSWNIHGGSADIGEIAAEIAEQDPDIVTLQEIIRWPDDDQVMRLAEALDMEPHFGFADEPGDACEPLEGEAGNAVLTKHTIAKRVTVPLTKSDMCVVDRSMAGTNITLDSGESVVVFTTHLTPGRPGDHPEQVKLRHAQARDAVDYLTHDHRLLFTGDMNEAPDGVVDNMITDAGFTDTGEVVGSGDTHRGSRIDYIYAKKLTPTGGESPPTDASDHRAVIIDLTLD